MEVESVLLRPHSQDKQIHLPDHLLLECREIFEGHAGNAVRLGPSRGEVIVITDDALDVVVVRLVEAFLGVIDRQGGVVCDLGRCHVEPGLRRPETRLARGVRVGWSHWWAFYALAKDRFAGVIPIPSLGLFVVSPGPVGSAEDPLRVSVAEREPCGGRHVGFEATNAPNASGIEGRM